jgi:hypothetical protein
MPWRVASHSAIASSLCNPYVQGMSIAHEHLLEIRELVKDHLAHKDEHELSRERQAFLKNRMPASATTTPRRRWWWPASNSWAKRPRS